MAKITTQRARKEYTCCITGRTILKGEMYQKVAINFGPTRVYAEGVKVPRAHTTTSEYLQQLYGILDTVESAEDLGDLESIAEEVEQLLEETQDKLDNMPEGLQEGDTGMLLQERIDQLESAKDEIDDVISDLEDLEEYDFEEWEENEYEVDRPDEDDFDTVDDYNEALAEWELEAQSEFETYSQEISNKFAEAVEQITDHLESCDI